MEEWSPPDPSAATVPLAEGTPTSGELVAGDTLAGRYAIRRRLGAGGMGVVYEAYDRMLDVTVALKVMRDADDGAARRLRRETQLAREVTHPNVCRIFDVGEEERDGKRRLFLTMERLEGATLAERLREAPLPPPEARPVIAAICAGLEAAHLAGIIHRDLKPANVMIAKSGRVVLTDFGVAALDADDDDSPTDAAHGRRGTSIAGTPDYMAPEQAAGQPAAPAGDLFALGIVITEIVTGARPFQPVRAGAGAASRDAPNADVLDRLPEHWRPVIRRCLARDPEARPESAGEVGRALFPSGRRRRLPIAIAVAVAIAAAGITVALVMRTRATAESAPGQPSDPHTVALLAGGVAQLDSGDLQRAVAAFEQVVAAEPELAVGWSQLSAAYRRLGREADALRAATRATGLAHGLPRALALRVDSNLHLANHDWPKAIAVLEALATLDPDDLSVSLDLAEARVLAGRGIAADSSLDALRGRIGVAGTARVELVAARAAELRGEPAKQRAAATAALTAARTAALPHLEARAFYERSEAEVELGEVDAAASDVGAAIAILDRIDDRRLLGLVHRVQARLAANRGDLEQSAGFLDRALADATAVDDQPGLAATHTMKAVVARRRGNAAEGAEHTKIALRIYRELRDIGGTADALSGLAHDALLAGNRAGATDSWSEALVLGRQIGDQRRNAIALSNLAFVAELQGELPSAVHSLEECARAAESANDRESVVDCRARLAWLAIEADRPEDARREATLLDALGPRERALATVARAYLDGDAKAIGAAADALAKAEERCGEQEARMRETELAPDRAAAVAAGTRAAELVEPCGDENASWRAAIAVARGAPAREAAAALDKLLAGSTNVIPPALVLDARIALVAALRDANRTAEAKRAATEIATAARRLGLPRLARRADQAIR